MKRITLLGILVLFISPLFAQSLEEKDVPKEVVKACSDKFHVKEEIDWTKNNATYEAEFPVDSNKVLATFDEKGNWIQTRTSQSFSTLPITVIVTVATKMEGQRISDSYKMEKPEGKVTYLVIVNDVEYVLNETGQILTKAGKEYQEP